MKEDKLQQLVHGYARGHTLLAASIELPVSDLDLVTRLSDLSGTLTTENDFYPYLTLYPLPSGEYFAVARTWLDAAAGRSGCVLTHTLLVPMGMWSRHHQPEVFANLLQLPRRDQLNQYSTPVAYSTQLECLPECGTVGNEVPRRSAVFTRRYFVEGISPLVWLGEKKPDDIAWRIVTFLWPALRSRFCCCTLAFQERSNHDGPFDLLFAPFAAVARFGGLARMHLLNEESRDGERDNSPVWLDDLGRAIFDPRGDEVATIRSLAMKLEGEPTAVRKVFMFETLAQRAQSSPTAALGALDILEQLCPSSGDCVDEKRRLVQMGIDSARRLPPATRFEQLFLLSARVDRPALKTTDGLWEEVAKTVKDMSRAAPGEAVRWVARLHDDRAPSESAYVSGLSLGLLETAREQPAVLFALSEYPSAAGKIFGEWPALAALFLKAARMEHNQPAHQVLLSWIQEADEEVLSAARRYLLTELRGKGGAAILNELLQEMPEAEVSSACTVLLAGAPGFDEETLVVLREQLGVRHAVEVRKWAATAPWSSRCAAAVVAGAFDGTQQGLGELLSISWLDWRRHGLLAVTFFEFAASGVIPHWIREYAATSQAFWSVLLTYSAEALPGVEVLARVAEQAQRSCIVSVPNAAQLISHVPASRASTMVQDHAMRQLVMGRVEGEVKDDTAAAWYVVAWCQTWFASVASSKLRRIFSEEGRAAADSWEGAWLFLADGPRQLYANDETVEELIETLGSITRWQWTERVVSAWMRIIGEIASGSRDRYVASASAALKYAVSHPTGPFGPLVAATFYVVHEAAMSREDDYGRLWTVWGFFQWDKAAELRNSVVDTFLRSKWDPMYLVLATREPWLLRKIARRLLRRHRGLEFLERAFRELKSGGAEASVNLRGALADILRNPHYAEDWE